MGVRRTMLLAALAGAIAGGILVHGRGQPGAQLAPSRYAGRQASGIRGLTTQEIDDLLQGRGAGFARTAELNGYAGPHHALDLAKELALSPEQRAVAESLFAAMRAAARALGAEIVDGERRLSAGFAERRITPADLEAQAESLGVRYGRLRAVHLAAHVALTRHLTHEQIRRYDALRGYDAHAPADTGAHDHGL